MKTKLYYFLVLLLPGLFIQNVGAQSPCAGRYTTEVFTNVSISTVTYDVWDSAMDIYQPTGDTSTTRPLIVLAHEGTFDAGNKTEDLTVVQECNNFAKRGYVVASINYRLIQSLVDFLDTTNVITEVIQALSDGKAAIRYFSKDAATTNLYRVDTNEMFIGGNSAGAVLAMHYGYIDSVGQCAPYLQTIINNNGGIEGNSGNAGYTSKVAGVISLAGGLNNPLWITPGDVTSFNAQGTSDDVVPYYCADAEGGLIMVRLCGLGSLEPEYVSNNIVHSSLLFPGQGHVPWDTSTSMFYTVDSALTIFLANTLCNIATSVPQVTPNAEIALFPNPAGNEVNIRSSVRVKSLNIFDETGREVRFINNIGSLTYQVNTSNLSKGVYFIKFDTGDNVVPLVKRVVIE
jgi:hypothetical protein